MPSFDIVKEIIPDKSFRVMSTLSSYTIETEKITEQFKGSIDIEDKNWNIGVIVGASGTGKTTIAKEVFGEQYITEYEYNASSVIDDMPQDLEIKDIHMAFVSVGFASPPSWLKPYNVLSNGEKMRVNLARAILENKDIIVFDEFTSVVNREVAQTGSYAIQKAVRKHNKKFIAVTCHSDILDWLEPDWIYNTDEQRFFFAKANTSGLKLKSIYTNLTINTKEPFGTFLESITI